MRVELRLDDPELVVLARVAERGPEEEAVELRLGQRERPLLLDRVLRREDEERIGELTGHAVDRHLPLRHRLEQRGLRLRHRAVDLVDEDDVREHRARAKFELAVALVEDREAGDVGRLQIRGALHAGRRRSLDRARDRPGEDRLRRPGHVLEKDMTPAEERCEDELDLLRLPADDRLDVRDESTGKVEVLVRHRFTELLVPGR